MSNKKSGLIVLIVIIVISILCAIVNSLSTSTHNENESPKGHNFDSTVVKNSKEGYIAAVYIEGLITDENSTYNQKWLLETIAKLKKDKRNKAIAIYINSPGGAVYETDEIYLAFQDYKTTGRPIYAYQANVAASGAYYISCAANKIYANRNTLTGSIGILFGSKIDATKFLENLGIKSQTFHSGKNKNMMNYNEPMTDEQMKIMQDIADDCYNQFLNVVATNRNMSIDDVKKIADGRPYTANQALSNKLVDAIDSWGNMINAIQKDCFEEKQLELKHFKYNRSPSLRKMLLEEVFGKETVKSLDSKISRMTLQYPAFILEQ